MLNKKFTTGILITVMLLAIIGLILVLFFIFGDMFPIIATDVSVIEINLEDGKEEVIEFKNLELIPGSEVEYNVKVTVDKSDEYVLSFDFITLKDSKLKKYTHVKIVDENGVVICDELLKNLLDTEGIDHVFKISKLNPLYLDIIYYMEESVGNEAKGLEMTFDIIVSADISE